MSGPISPSGSNDGFTVDLAGLAAHAALVASFADRVRQAAGTALPVPTEAYGRVGQLFVGNAINASAEALRAVTMLAEAGERAAAGLNTQLAAYQAVERDNAAMFSRIHP